MLHLDRVSVARVLPYPTLHAALAAIQRLARDKVLWAIDAGWTGPPFNPIRLADLLKIPVEPKASVSDARTVPRDDGIKIEFNPLQSRERLRFSIVHRPKLREGPVQRPT
jgi:hypothetical protein